MPYEIRAVQEAAALAGVRHARNLARSEQQSNSPVSDGQLTHEDLDGMSPAEIVSAKRAGHLDALLGRTQ
jgi:HD-like signal output (HDOD) protein